jgi:2-hydroxychromene-2-carboxylate isomerase
MDDATRKRLVSRLFAGVWAEGLDMGSAPVVARLCEEMGIRDALSRIEDPAVKQSLHDASREAIDLGIFGVPTMVVDGEPFWGTDSFAHLERYLTGDDPVRPGDLARWQAVPASAHRRTSR